MPDGGDLDVPTPVHKASVFDTPPTLPPQVPGADLRPQITVQAAAAPVGPIEIQMPLIVLDGVDPVMVIEPQKPGVFDTPPTLPPLLLDDDATAVMAVGDEVIAPESTLSDLVGPIDLAPTLPGIDLSDLLSQLWPDQGGIAAPAPAPSPFDTPPLIGSHCTGATSLAHCNRLIELMAVGEGGAAGFIPQPSRFEHHGQVFTP